MYCCFRAHTALMLKKAPVLSGRGIRWIFCRFSLSRTQPSCWACTFWYTCCTSSPSPNKFTSHSPVLKKQKPLRQEFEVPYRKKKKLPPRRLTTLIQLLTFILKGEGLKRYVYRPRISAWDYSASVLGLSNIISNKLDEGILSSD